MGGGGVAAALISRRRGKTQSREFRPLSQCCVVLGEEEREVYPSPG